MRIGLTGSMAAGKSTVSAMLRELGFFIVDADKTAHDALELPEVRNELREAFGESIFAEGGMVDRSALAAAAFSAKESTEALNAIVHPRVFESMLAKAQCALSQGREHVVFDVPLLFESGFERYCDRVICVVADDETRFGRIMRRDGLTREQAAARFARQMPQREKAARADAVIENSGSMDRLEAQVLTALQSIGIDVFSAFAQNELSVYTQDDPEE